MNIIDPITNKSYSILSKNGKDLLKSYVHKFQLGGNDSDEYMEFGADGWVRHEVVPHKNPEHNIDQKTIDDIYTKINVNNDNTRTLYVDIKTLYDTYEKTYLRKKRLLNNTSEKFKKKVKYSMVKFAERLENTLKKIKHIFKDLTDKTNQNIAYINRNMKKYEPYYVDLKTKKDLVIKTHLKRKSEIEKMNNFIKEALIYSNAYRGVFESIGDMTPDLSDNEYGEGKPINPKTLMNSDESDIWDSSSGSSSNNNNSSGGSSRKKSSRKSKKGKTI